MKGESLVSIPHRHPKSAEGVYLVSLLVVALVLAGMIALSLGIGFVYSSESRLQVVANLASMGALEAYARVGQQAASDSDEDSDGDNVALEADKRAAALARANELLGLNPLPGMEHGFGELSFENDPNSAGVIEFGRYYDNEPEDDPCNGGDYPCFRIVDATERASAIRIILHTTPDNPLISVAGKILGKTSFQLEREASASMVETCTAYLLDVSMSSVSDEYRPIPTTYWKIGDDPYVGFGPPGPGSPYEGIEPPTPGSLFAYRATCVASDVGLLSCSTDTNFLKCQDDDSPDGSGNPDLVHFCSMRPERNGADPAPAPREHFRSDYVYRSVFDGEHRMLVAKYNPEIGLGYPRPLDEFLRGFNAGLRLVASNATADQAVLMAFTGDHFNRTVPHTDDVDLDPEDIPFSTDLGYMIQVTNLSNIGKVGGEVDASGVGVGIDDSEKIPNIFDKGFFPSYLFDDISDPTSSKYSATNIVKAIWDVAEAMNAHCPRFAKKQIILATDGMSNCKYLGPAQWGEEPPSPYDKSGPNCDRETPWMNYKFSEWALVTRVLPILKRDSIALTTILSGASIDLKYRNRKLDQNDLDCQEHDDNPNCFLDFDTAQAAGLGGYSNGDPTGWDNPDQTLPDCNGSGTNGSFFRCESSFYSPPNAPVLSKNTNPVAHRAAFEEMGFRDGVKFGRPLPVFGHLAFKTGGRVCPILPRGDVSDYYDHDGDDYRNLPENDGCATPAPDITPCRLKNTARANNPYESRALDYLSEGEQGARCVEQAVGKNLYALIEPLSVCGADGCE